MGKTKKKIELGGTVDGVLLPDLGNAISTTFGLEKDGLILQAYDKDFEDFVDIEEERIAGPTKIMVKVKAPVVSFPVTINVNEGNIIQDVQSDLTIDEGMRYSKSNISNGKMGKPEETKMITKVIFPFS